MVLAPGLRVYYAHSMQIYGSDREREEHQWLHQQGYQVCNPNGKMNAQNWLKRSKDLIQACDCVVFSEHKGHIGRGVTQELWRAFDMGKPIYVLRNNRLFPVFSRHIKVVDRNWAVHYARIAA